MFSIDIFLVKLPMVSELSLLCHRPFTKVIIGSKLSFLAMLIALELFLVWLMTDQMSELKPFFNSSDSL